MPDPLMPLDVQGRKLAQKHLDYMASDEFRDIRNRWFAHTATDEDILQFIDAELTEALDSLEPQAPSNGRPIDGWHASAAVLRAWVVLLKYRERKTHA